MGKYCKVYSRGIEGAYPYPHCNSLVRFKSFGMGQEGYSLLSCTFYVFMCTTGIV